MRPLITSFMAVALTAFTCTAASPQNLSGPIKIIVTGPAGGTPDIIARTAAEKMSQSLGVAVVVENKPGGQAAVGSVQQVAKAPPDGLTLLQANTSLFSIGPPAYKNPVYDPEKDFVPVSVMATSPNVLVVSAQMPVKSAAELVAILKSNPKKYLFASGGIGTPMHLYGEVLKNQHALDFVHVPYQGSAPAIVGVLSGQVHFMFDQIPSVLPHIQSGAFRAVAVANKTRISSLPDVPTFAEVGLDGADAVSWFGLVAPKGTPAAIVARLSEAVSKAMKEPAVVEKLKTLGADAVGSTPAEMTEHVKAQLNAWVPLVKISGVTLE